MTTVKHDPCANAVTGARSVDLTQAATLWRTLTGELPAGAVLTVLRARRTRDGGAITEYVAAVATEADYLDAVTEAAQGDPVAVYVSVNALDGEKLSALRKRKPSARGGQAQLAATLAVVADLDHAGGVHAGNGLPQVEQLPELLNGLPAPSLVIDTGGGWHVWWALSEPVTDHDTGKRARHAVRSVLKRNGDALGVKVDLGVTTDAARILRVPGSWNGKGSEPVPVRILSEGAPVDLLDLLSLDVTDEAAEALSTAPPALAPVPAPADPYWDTFTAPASTGADWVTAAVADFDTRHTWEQVLPGWERVGSDDTGTHYRRPGNTSSYKSATVYADSGRLTVWSESTGFGDSTAGSGQHRTWDKLDAALVASGAVPSPETRVQLLREQGYGPTPKNEAPVTAPAATTATAEGDRVHPDPSTLSDIEGADDGDMPSSWAPIDLSALLDGTYEPVTPTLLPRTDGVCLLYPGRVHSMHGESESGKSFVAQAEAVRAITDGHPVLYLDFEADEVEVVGRLLIMGASPQAIRDHFTYVRPETRPATPGDIRAYRGLLTGRYALAVIDGVTDALGIWNTGASSSDNDAIAGFMRTFPRRLAQHTGAAVVLIDHVTKDSDTRGRFAIGGQAKMAALDGASYTVEVDQIPTKGGRGVLILRCGKDRPGQVRPHCGPFRKSDRTQEAARIVIDSTGAGTVVTVEPYRDAAADDSSQDFRPTGLMEKVSRALEGAGAPLSLRDLRDMVTGRAEYLAAAIAVLVADGYVTREIGPRNAQLHTLTRRYRQSEDPASDRYSGPLPGSSTGSREPGTTDGSGVSDSPTGSGSRSKDRGTGNQSFRGDSTGSGNQSGTGGNQSIDTLGTGFDGPSGEAPVHACSGPWCQVEGCPEGGR